MCAYKPDIILGELTLSLLGKVGLILRGPPTVPNINGTSFSVSNNTFTENELVEIPMLNGGGDSCTFTTKVWNVQQAGAVGVIMGNNVGENWISPMWPSDEPFVSLINIPSISVSHNTYSQLLYAYQLTNEVIVTLSNEAELHPSASHHSFWQTISYVTLAVFSGFSILLGSYIIVRALMRKFRQMWDERQRTRRLGSIPLIQYQECLLDSNESEAVDVEEQERPENWTHNQTCVICLNEFDEGELIKLLPCRHGFHEDCINRWLISAGKCPICVQQVFEI